MLTLFSMSPAGKDKAIFLTREDAKEPERIKTLAEDEAYGLIAKDGSINWDCPCLGNNEKIIIIYN